VRNPDFLTKRKIPLENRTGPEVPAGGEIQPVLKNLQLLMEREKPYLDEDLSMRDLASLLGIARMGYRAINQLGEAVATFTVNHLLRTRGR
jgi:hypothetical protein